MNELVLIFFGMILGFLLAAWLHSKKIIDLNNLMKSLIKTGGDKK